MMAETCLLAEKSICYPPLYDELRALTSRPVQTVEAIGMSAVSAAYEANADAILVLSTSGNTARLIAKYRPNVPIITGTSVHYSDRDRKTDCDLQLRAASRPRARFTSTGAFIRSGTLSRVASRRTSGRLTSTTASGLVCARRSR